MPILTVHYGESPYKTCLYEDFLNLYGGGQEKSIFTTGIIVPNPCRGLADMDPNVPERHLIP
jgi:hypothetical protein